MKKIGYILAFLFALAAPAMADPAEGVWKTPVDDGNYGHISISMCGAKLCGVIARSFNSEGEFKSKNQGKRLLWDMEPLGGGSYGNGSIWQPSKDKVYASKMSLSGDKLYVSGCWGPICKKQTWVRVK